MKVWQRLGQIFGPLLLAILLITGLLIAPLKLGRLRQPTLQEAAVSLSPNVFKGQKIKQQALQTGYVPFMGSSELSRMDPLHPSVLAAKYHRHYRPLLIGAAGTQSLVHFLMLQSMGPALKNKKVVFIISPQWFTPQGQRSDAFNFYYSPLETITWLQQAHNTQADRYAARRLLAMNSTSGLITKAITQIAIGEKLTPQQHFGLRVTQKVLQNEDALFSRFRLKNNLAKIKRGEQQLPNKATLTQLDHFARQQGAANTTNNHFGIDNEFYRKYLSQGRLAALKGQQKSFDYRRSPEYSDFELLLNQFAKWHIQVQFVIPPINQRWANYTKLSLPMIRATDQKIKYQLRQQGFTHILDMTSDGNQPYFMQDTIHLGWRGWLRVDQAVEPFLTETQVRPHYHLQSQFFSQQWQQAKTGGRS
ncbi:D-alanyl-lipoteichoic acid biosynthesis protein DltD [Loigolactobacillus coryniformis]|uniref:D-alanyl-lipoteichoic acid biosynthesis protein DltD n=1 Tax=Loigolactobacillus coryniformis TaxID=1610 RepID=UPI00345D8B29